MIENLFLENWTMVLISGFVFLLSVEMCFDLVRRILESWLISIRPMFRSAWKQDSVSKMLIYLDDLLNSNRNRITSGYTE